MIRSAIILLFVFVVINAQNCSLSSQKSALLKLYDLNGGPGWLVNKPGWRDNSSLDICSWFGVSCCTNETCTSGDPYCVCSIGFVSGLYLQGNNLSGSMIIGSSSNSDAQLITSALGCSLLEIEVQNNNLVGSLPSLVSISHLRLLNLGGNKLTSALPSAIGSLTSLIAVDLSDNLFTGTIPQDICYIGGPLTDLSLAGNRFSGTLDLSLCNNLVYIDASQNANLGGSVTPPTGFNRLHVVYLSETKIRDVSGLMTSSELLSDLNLDMTAINGSLPSGIIPGFRFLNRLSVKMDKSSTNYLLGTIPPSLLQIAALRQLDLSNNWLSGTLPAIGEASSMTSLVLSNNRLSGTLPSTMINVFSSNARVVDLRLNYMSCCGVGALQGNLFSGSVGYGSYNLSAPRLPSGVKFSSTLQPVQQIFSSSQLNGTMLNLGNSSYPGLSCPYLLPTSAADTPSNFLSWLIDPEYYLFEGCQCSNGLTMVIKSVMGLSVPQCISQSSAQTGWWTRLYWIFIILGVALIALILFVLYHALNSHRPKVIQNILDAQKRSKGPPTSGMISIVTTDIEGFSDLMKSSPDLMMPALLIHNNLIQKAKFANFGYTIEQEGDAYSIVFEKSSDAVKFCLQAQLLLAKQKWPKGLFRQSELRTYIKETSKVTRMAQGVRGATSRVFATVESWMGGKSASPGSPSYGGRRPNTAEDNEDLRTPGSYANSEMTEHDDLRDEVGPHKSGNSASSSKGAPSEMGFHSSFASSAGGHLADRNFSDRIRLVGSAINGLPGGSPQDSFTSEAAPSLGPSVKGLKVRMGIATGILPQGRSPAGSHILEQAKVVGDAGAGGQVLMCSTTFSQVKDLTEEFGCVTEAGLRREMMEQRNPFTSLWRWLTRAEDVSRGNEAVLLDMGQFMYCKDDNDVPSMMTAADLAEAKEEATSATSGKLKGPVEEPISVSTIARTLSRSFSGNKIAPAPTLAATAKARKLLRLYQILSPSLVERGRLFGSKLALKDEWVKIDSSYFDAPGTLNAALSPTDQVLTGASSGMPFIGMVFCLVEGGKGYASKHRADASVVHQELVAIIKSTLRQIPQGYFVRSQDGDLKYLIAFSTSEAALFWCISMQMVSMYHKWPSSAHKQWPEEYGENGELLFRGPRLKMGMCEGYANSVLPDHLGRADYHGSSINQAARFMDAAAHGGQVACLESTVTRVAEEWRRISCDFFDGEDGYPVQPLGGSDDDSEDADDASYAPEECRSAIFVPIPKSTSIDDLADEAVSAFAAASVIEADSPARLAPEASTSLLNRGRVNSMEVEASPASSQKSIRFREKEASFKIIDDGPLDLNSSFKPAPSKSRFALLDEAGDPTLGRAGSSGVLKPRAKFGAVDIDSGIVPSMSPRMEGLTASLISMNSNDPYSDLGPTASSHGLSPQGPLNASLQRPSILKHSSIHDRLGQKPGGEVLPLRRTSSGNGMLKMPMWQMPDFDSMVNGNQIEVTVVRVGQFKFKGSPEALSMVNVTPTLLLDRKYPADPPKGKGGRVGETSGTVVNVVIPMMKFIDQCKAQFEDDNQYSRQEDQQAHAQEEPTDAAGMMNSLAGLVAQSVSAAFFRPSARSVSNSSTRSEGVTTTRDEGERDELAVIQSGHSMAVSLSGHSRFSAHSNASVRSNPSDIDRRTMNALEAIRAEDKKRRLAEMNAAKATSPTPSAVNLALPKSASGKIRFSDLENPKTQSDFKTASSSKRVNEGVKFNGGEEAVDLEKGLISKPPRPQSAKARGGLKKVTIGGDGDDELTPLPGGGLDRSESIGTVAPPTNQRRLLSFASTPPQRARDTEE